MRLPARLPAHPRGLLGALESLLGRFTGAVSFDTKGLPGWIAAGRGEPLRKISSPIAQDWRSGRNRPILDDLKGCIALQPRDDAATGLIERRPPPIIVIAEIENIARPASIGIALAAVMSLTLQGVTIR